MGKHRERNERRKARDGLKKRGRKNRRRANRKYKDRLFIRIFEDREDLLRLYNAVNASDYPCADDLEVLSIIS